MLYVLTKINKGLNFPRGEVGKDGIINCFLMRNQLKELKPVIPPDRIH